MDSTADNRDARVGVCANSKVSAVLMLLDDLTEQFRSEPQLFFDTYCAIHEYLEKQYFSLSQKVPDLALQHPSAYRRVPPQLLSFPVKNECDPITSRATPLSHTAYWDAVPVPERTEKVLGVDVVPLHTPDPPQKDSRLRSPRGTALGMWIHLWPCFGTTSASFVKPTRAFVRPGYRYIEDITECTAKQLNCQPAPSVLYEPHGKEVRSIFELSPEGHYLLFPSGGFYRRDAVPKNLLTFLVRAAKQSIEASD